MSKLFISENKFQKTRVPFRDSIKFVIIQNETVDDEVYEDSLIWQAVGPASRFDYPVTGKRKEVLARHDIYLSINESVSLKLSGQELINLHTSLSNVINSLNNAMESV
jgi:hypothetical protein